MLRIATTETRDLQALALAGQSALESWRVLSRLLAERLSPAHAALLAEPVQHEAQGTVDWYSDAQGTATPLEDLPEPARTEARDTLARLTAGIVGLTGQLAASRADGDRFLAEMLGLALRLPGPGYAYVVAGQPVLVAWAHVRSGGRGEEVVLTGAGSAGRAQPMAILPPPPSPLDAATPSRRWLWPAIGASLLVPILAVLLLLFDPFGLLLVTPAQCRLAPGQLDLAEGLRDAVAQEGVLRSELSRLTADAGQRRLMCPTPAVQPRLATPVPPPAPPVPAPSADAQRAERQGAGTGKLQIILAWDDTNDLDLRIVCPSGLDINFIRRELCGGRLDIDANGDVRSLTSSPVENVFFIDPPPGQYRVVVDPYGMRARPASPFRVTIRREGRPDQVIQGTAVNGQRNRTVTEFRVDAP